FHETDFLFLSPGEPAQFDPTFKGPMKKRGCTDIICLILFMAVILGYIVVGILAWLYGDPRHVLYPRNSTGWFCGIGPNKDQPNLFYMNILKCATSVNVMASALNGLQCPTTQVCVAQCPSTFWAVGIDMYFKKPAELYNCGLSLSLFALQTYLLVIACFLFCIGFTWPFASHYCGRQHSLFSLLSLIRDIVNGFNAKEIGVRIFEDFASSWPWILLEYRMFLVDSDCLRIIFSFSITGIWHCYWEYANYKSASATITNVGFTTNLQVYLQVQETWLAFLIIISVVEAILLLTIIFLRTRILIAIALIQESSKAIGHMMSALVYPLVTFVLLLVCVAYWGATALYLATSGSPIYRVVALNSSQGDCSSISGNVSCDPQVPSCIFIKYNNEGLFQRNLFNLQIYNVVAFLWCVNFVIALGHCTLAGAFASYYWAFTKPGDIPMFPVCGGFIRALRYHVGSLAFGALILTLVQIARILLEYIDQKTRAAQNPVARFILCCMKCCLWCLEKFIKFLNRNAYIMIAIYGKNFCVSAKNAFKLLMRNIIRVVVLDKVTDILLFFGKLLVVGGVGVLSFFFFSGRIRLPGNVFRSETLNYYWMPIITVVFGSYLIAHGFFSVYNMCVDTLFLCFLEDLERNDGSLQKPYFMSKNLMKILNKSNKAQKKGKGKE
uniref:Choline transporter-like protein n=1 Tax=Anabas testudineus TaxID=64144 RepID=A0A7N6BZ00_ANATE